jgi:hypothetical protein
MTVARIRTAAILGLVLGTAVPAGAVTLVPHRAVYDLALAEGRARSENTAGMTGRMVFEFTGAACEGYTVNFRFVVEATGADGMTTVTDLRTSSFEAAAGDSYQFLSQTYSNRALTEEVKGSAAREGDALAVTLTLPKPAEVRLEGGPLFPTQHLAAVIAAAESGRTVYEQSVYDGSDAGNKMYRTTAVIGSPRPATPTGTEAAIGTDRRWPVSIAYFAAKAEGDQVPEYAISFDLWDNGVSSDLTMDYGDFALSGSLTDFETLPQTPCP